MENNNTTDPFENFEKSVRDIHSQIEKENKAVFAKYPLVFSLLATFGVVAVVHGFERMVDAVPFLDSHPYIIFCIGILILFSTGRLYKFLQK